MNHLEILGLLLIIFFLINKFLISKKIFIDPKNNSYHKSFLKNTGDTPYSGGIIILLSSLIFFSFKFPYLTFFIVLLFSIGLLSDLEVIKSPFRRIIFQIIIISAYLIISKNLVPYTRIEFLDIFFENFYVKFFFTLFCILVLINGSNFIDGVNTLTATYYLMVFACFIYLKYNFHHLQQHDVFIEEVIVLALFVFLIFNFFGKAYLGDNGAYLISFIVGTTSISWVNTHVTISPYFVVCLLWYPAFENLFSIIRKKIQKFPASNPDNKHLHQLLFIFLKKNFKFNPKLTNTLTGFIINIYNFFIFLIAVNFHSETKILVSIIIFNVFIYCSVYYFLIKNNKK